MALWLSSAAFDCLAAFRCIRALGMIDGGAGGKRARRCGVLAPRNEVWVHYSPARLCAGGLVRAEGSWKAGPGGGRRGARDARAADGLCWEPPLTAAARRPAAPPRAASPEPGGRLCQTSRDLPPGGRGEARAAPCTVARAQTSVQNLPFARPLCFCFISLTQTPREPLPREATRFPCPRAPAQPKARRQPPKGICQAASTTVCSLR